MAWWRCARATAEVAEQCDRTARRLASMPSWTTRSSANYDRVISCWSLSVSRWPIDLRVILVGSIKHRRRPSSASPTYAKNTAKRIGIVRNQRDGAARPVALGIDRHRHSLVLITALKDVLDAFAQGDVAKAQRRLAAPTRKSIRSYTGRVPRAADLHDGGPAQRSPRARICCSCAKNIERAGDHVTNIAELTTYHVTGHGIDETRPPDQRLKHRDETVKHGRARPRGATPQATNR